jgi:hypothetical protein
MPIQYHLPLHVKASHQLFRVLVEVYDTLDVLVVCEMHTDVVGRVVHIFYGFRVPVLVLARRRCDSPLYSLGTFSHPYYKRATLTQA